MKKKLLAGLAVGVMMLGMTGIASATTTTIFSDNFDGENLGLNQYNFTNWTVSKGSVDLIGAGYFDLLPGNGNFVDMDGTTNEAGILVSKTAFNLGAGDYFLKFDLAGNQRIPSGDTVTVQVNNGITSNTYSLGWEDPFQTFTNSFTLSSTTAVSLSFEGIGGDMYGILLDNVRLEKVDPVATPIPGAIWLLGSGLAGLIGARRKKK